MNSKRITIDFSDVNSQRTAVMYHLMKFGSITSLEAIKEYGITRVAEYIRQLRSEGYSIVTEDVNFKNRFGHHASYGKYVYNDPNLVDEKGQIKMEL